MSRLSEDYLIEADRNYKTVCSYRLEGIKYLYMFMCLYNLLMAIYHKEK